MEHETPGLEIALLISNNPYLDFARALALYYQPPRPAPGVHPLAYVAPTATVGENCSIDPLRWSASTCVWDATQCYTPMWCCTKGWRSATISWRIRMPPCGSFCRIGNRVILQNGVVVGGDGYGFAKRADGSHFKIVQSGVTVIEDDVEIQTLTSVDRATVGETRIKRGAKIDSLVQVGHACTVGEDNIICAQTGLAGSTVLEKNVLLAGQVGASGHLTVHEGAIVYAQSGIGGDVEKSARISGSPAFPAQRMASFRHRIPEIARIAEDRKGIEEESR
ncbi:MAG: UDP-3-O-(3-hydroxymyristoyl)glucosamine N-acyltransferase [Ignavibacteriota bacterium]